MLISFFASLNSGLVSFGAPLGLKDIAGEKSTHDGNAPDIFARDTDALLHYLPDRAVDGYSAASLDALYVHPLSFLPALSRADGRNLTFLLPFM